jgi:methionyl-tRNA synthetase
VNLANRNAADASYELTAEQTEIRDQARKFFMKEIHPLQQRMDDEDWWPDTVMPALGTMGYLGVTVPAEDGQDRVKTRVLTELKKVQDQLDKLQFHFALATIISAVELLNGFIEEQAPWKLAKTSPVDCQSVLRELLVCIKLVTFYLVSFMPDTAQTVWMQLGQSDDLTAAAKRFFLKPDVVDLLPAGQKVSKGTPLFPRVVPSRKLPEQNCTDG